jgi:hypothetical protein
MNLGITTSHSKVEFGQPKRAADEMSSIRGDDV